MLKPRLFLNLGDLYILSILPPITLTCCHYLAHSACMEPGTWHLAPGPDQIVGLEMFPRKVVPHGTLISKRGSTFAFTASNGKLLIQRSPNLKFIQSQSQQSWAEGFKYLVLATPPTRKLLDHFQGI